jgi:hypothetical protein
MARKLKTFQTSLGFYDLAIAAPSMKAALEAWGAGSNLFHQGVAKETDDPDVVAATMSKPGVVLKRPAGSNGRFAEHSDLPSDLESAGKGRRREGRRTQPAKKPPRKTEAALAALAERHAALRVGFADDGERPVQVVRREARPRLCRWFGARHVRDGGRSTGRSSIPRLPSAACRSCSRTIERKASISTRARCCGPACCASARSAICSC